MTVEDKRHLFAGGRGHTGWTRRVHPAEQRRQVWREWRMQLKSGSTKVATRGQRAQSCEWSQFVRDQSVGIILERRSALQLCCRGSHT